MSRAEQTRSRIVIVGKGHPEQGGIASFITTLLDSRLAHDFDLSFCNLARQERAVGGQLSWSNLTRTLVDLRLVWGASGGADVVHLQTAAAPLITLARAGVFAAVARLRGASVLLHAHGGRVEQLPTVGAKRLFIRLALGLVARVATVSRRGEQALRPLAGSRVVYVANGVDTTRFHPAPSRTAGPPVVLFAGTLTPRKGVLDLIEASQNLRGEGVDHVLRLAGGTSDDGREAELEVRTAAEEAGAELLGPLPPDRMPDVYAAADVFCLPSWWEAMPLTVLEAMAAGLPVVATTVGDMPLLVDAGTTGQLVPVRQTSALTEALRRYLDDEQLRRDHGTAGRARVEQRYDLDATIDTLAGLYLELSR